MAPEETTITSAARARAGAAMSAATPSSQAVRGAASSCVDDQGAADLHHHALGRGERGVTRQCLMPRPVPRPAPAGAARDQRPARPQHLRHAFAGRRPTAAYTRPARRLRQRAPPARSPRAASSHPTCSGRSDLRLLRQPTAVGRQLARARCARRDHVAGRAIDQVQQHRAALDMAEEAVTQARRLRARLRSGRGCRPGRTPPRPTAGPRPAADAAW